MSSHIESKDSELLIDLSEQEQEGVCGGRSRHSSSDAFNFFFQLTNIRSASSSSLNISHGSISSSSQSEYTLSQITIGISSLYGGKKHRSGGLSRSDLFWLLVSLL